MLCVLINLNHSLYLVLINLESFELSSLRSCLEGKHECSHNLALQDMLQYAQLSCDQYLDKSLNSTLVNTYSSFNNLETNKWSSRNTYGHTLQI